MARTDSGTGRLRSEQGTQAPGGARTAPCGEVSSCRACGPGCLSDGPRCRSAAKETFAKRGRRSLKIPQVLNIFLSQCLSAEGVLSREAVESNHIEPVIVIHEPDGHHGSRNPAAAPINAADQTLAGWLRHVLDRPSHRPGVAAIASFTTPARSLSRSNVSSIVCT